MDSDESTPVCLPEDGLKHYWKERNAKSLDGLPGLLSAPESRTRFLPVDPKSIQARQPSRSLPRWMDSQTVIAFTLGMATSATLLRVFQQQRY